MVDESRLEYREIGIRPEKLGQPVRLLATSTPNVVVELLYRVRADDEQIVPGVPGPPDRREFAVVCYVHPNDTSQRHYIFHRWLTWDRFPDALDLYNKIVGVVQGSAGSLDPWEWLQVEMG